MRRSSRLLPWLPPPEKEGHLPKNLFLVQSQLGWITQKISPLVHSSFPCSLSTGTSAQPKARGASRALHKSSPQLPGTAQASLVQQPCSTGDRKLSTEQENESSPTRMGWDTRGLRKCVSPLCFLDRAFLSQILQHVTVLLFSVNHKNKQNPHQTLQTAQLSWVRLPEVLMSQETVCFSRRCSQCLHSVTASSIIKTCVCVCQKESLSLAWLLTCCT